MSEVSATASLQNFDIKHVRFVRPAPYGNDNNNGKSWSSAKETILAAYDDIPEGDGGGVIYIAHQSKIGHNVREGIWIVGNSDPIFTTLGVAYSDFDGSRDMSVDRNGSIHDLLRGWRKEKKVLFKGVGGANPVAYGHPGAAQIGPDFQNGNNHFLLNDDYPAIWLSGVSELAFEDLIINNRSVGIRIGITVQHHKPVVTGYLTFRRVYVDVVGKTEVNPALIEELPSHLRPPHGDSNQRRRYMWTRVGPAVEMEWALWVRFDSCVFVNSSMDAATNDPSLRVSQHGYSDRHSGILVRKNGGSAAVLFISDCIFKNGNLKYYAGGGPFNFNIRNCMIESVWDTEGLLAYNPPAIHLIYPQLEDGLALIENVGAGDIGVGEANQPHGTVFVEGASGTTAESIVCINTADVFGAATIINRPAPRTWQNETQTLGTKKQVGFWQGRVAGQHDSARRAFSPVAIRFKNLMPQDPQEITRRATGNATLTTNVLAPDGTRRAFNLSANSNGLQSKLIVSRRIVVRQPVNAEEITVNEGDIIIAGVWARAASPNGFLPSVTSIVNVGFHDYRYRFEGTQESVLKMGAPLKGDGEWEWLSVAGKVSKHSGFDTDLEMTFFCLDDRPNNRVYSHDFYAPLLLYIHKSEGVSDNEMHELRQHLSTWPDNVEPGTVSLLRGQDFAVQSHIVSKGTKPIVPIGAHDPALIEIDGNDVSGRISVKAGSIINDGIIATLEFSKLFRSKARVLLTAANHHASTIPIFVESSEQKFSIHTTTITSGRLEQDSVWNYFVIE